MADKFVGLQFAVTANFRTVISLTSYAWGGWGSRSSENLAALQERGLCLGGQENWKLCLRPVDACCISQFVVRAVWKALAWGRIHETSDNGAEEGSGELLNLAGRYLQGLC